MTESKIHKDAKREAAGKRAIHSDVGGLGVGVRYVNKRAEMWGQMKDWFEEDLPVQHPARRRGEGE